MATLFNAAEAILRRSRSLPELFAGRAALIEGAHRVSYSELWQAVDRAAAMFGGLGLTRGERIALLLRDGPLAAAAFLGGVLAGCVPVPLNSRLAAQDLAFVLGDCAARLLIAETDWLSVAASLPAPALGVMPVSGAGDSFAARLAEPAPPTDPAVTCAEDPAFWLYSSGTTGRPKGIIHSHSNCAQAGKLLREAIGAGEHTVVLATSKSFFAYGLENGLLGPLSLGATSVQFAQWPEPADVVDQVVRHHVNCLLTVPSFYRRMLQLGHERLAPMKRVSIFYTGGERLPETVAVEWRQVTGKPIHVGYGLSETLCNATANFPSRDRSPASIGEPLAGVACRILDAQGREVPAGEPGILWIRHPSMTTGYSDPRLDARAFRDGWLCTNDLCSVDAEGFLYHHGRADELTKISGQWVKPHEIEDAVLADPAIREAACVVVKDHDDFERIALFIVASAGEPDALSAASERCERALPRFSRPRWIRTVEELPKNATGKIQRFRLREALERELGVRRPGE